MTERDLTDPTPARRRMKHRWRRAARPAHPRTATPHVPPQHVPQGASASLDATADIGRRAWVGCPTCAQDHQACPTCQDGRTCELHWRYLLATAGGHLFLQCPACLRRWWHDTSFGQGGGRPLDLADVLDPPGERR